MSGDPYLYILMRSDMASLNSGKMAAQATHAANQCIFQIKALIKSARFIGGCPLQWQIHLKNWQENRGFGVCIVLDVRTEPNLLALVDAAANAGLVAGVTHDPTYPVRDGEVTHLIPVNTCGYVFGPKEQCAPILGQLPLYP